MPKKQNEKKEVATAIEPKTGFLRAPNFQKLYVTNVKGGLTSHDFRFELMNEKTKDDDGNTFFVSDGIIILSPIGAKRLFLQLTSAIKEFEVRYGEIPENPEEDRFIRLT